MSESVLPELANLCLYGLGWPAITPAHATLYFSEEGWEQVVVGKLWLVEGQLRLRLIGAKYGLDRTLGTRLLGSEPPLVPMNRPSWCENPLVAVALFPDGIGFAWQTRRPVAIKVVNGALSEYVI